MDKDEAIKNLMDIGMTMYEARTFVALTALGEATVGEIYPQAEVPRSAVYEVLDRLVQKGIIEVARGRPRKFRALQPASAMKKIESAFSRAKLNATKALEKIYRSGEHEKPEEAIWIIKGRDNVRDKVDSLLEKAKKEIIAGASVSRVLELEEQFKSAREKRVRVQILTMEEEAKKKLDGLGEVIVLPLEEDTPIRQLEMCLLIIDSKVALFSSTYMSGEGVPEETAFWSDSPAFVSFLKFSAERVIESTPRKGEC